MLFLFLALLFFGVWWIFEHDSENSLIQLGKGSPLIKWFFYAIIASFLLLELFVFIETNRLVEAHSGAGVSCDTNGTVTCPDCCIHVNTVTADGPENLTLVEGGYVAGSISSLQAAYDDDIYIATLATQGVALDLRVNFTGVDSYSAIRFRHRLNTSENLTLYYQLWDGSAWQSFWAGTTTNAWVYQTTEPLNTYIINGTVQMRMYIPSGAINTSDTFEQDYLALTGAGSEKMYCSDTEDTYFLLIVHRTEYGILTFITGNLMWLGMGTGALLVLHYMGMWYNLYRKGGTG